MSNETLIRLEHVNIEWDHRTVLHDINLEINRGDFIAIT